MSPVGAARWKILCTAALFSTGGAAIKACSMGGWQVATFRSGIAAVAIAFMLPAARRGWTWKTLAVAVAYAATLICFVLSNKLTTAANTIFLQSSAPLYLLLLSPWLLRERILLRDLLFMGALALGIACFFLDATPKSGTAPDPALGNLLACASGLGWAFTVAGLRWLARGERGSSDVAAAGTLAGNVLALVVCLPFALPVAQSTPRDWLLLLFLGVFQIGLAYVLLTSGMRHVPALEGSLLLLLEPVLNPLWAWMFQGEIAGRWAFAGALVILLATAVHSWRAATDPAGTAAANSA